MNKVKIRHSFVFKLSLYIVICLVITFLSVLVYNYYECKRIIVEGMKKNVEILATSTIREVGSFFNVAQQITEDISLTLENSKITEKELVGLLKDVVRNNYEIHGCTISFEPYSFDKTKYYFSPYFYRSTKGVAEFIDLGDEQYNYFKRSWYTTPKQSNKGVWSEPYLDEGSVDLLMVTRSEPFYRTINGKREFCGVIACDVHLNWLDKFVSDIKILDTGYVFILSSKGAYIEHKNKAYIRSRESIFSLAERRQDVKLKELGKKMSDSQAGFERYYSYTLDKECFVFYAPLKETGWSLGVVIPEDELFFDLNTVTLKLFIIGLVGYILTMTIIIVLSTKMSMPLRTLAGATHEIGEGDFSASLPAVFSTDEIGMLSHSFRSMQKNLVNYMSNLQETTAAKEKIDRELSIAHDIQQNLLPYKFPNLKQLDLYATIIPAKEVGGDLYDFFFIDEKHLCFAIGDVSGKGVPAALFMAVTKTLLRAKISLSMDPSKILNVMNEYLCRENEPCMFVTFFLGILNIETGFLEYCNAGHPPPLVHTANKGFYYFNTDDAHPPLGIMADVSYVGNRLKLLPEDIFFIYTDGVTEAMNIDYVQFSEEKLLDLLVQNKNETVVNIVNNVKSAVDRHVSGAVQSDDIAILIFKYNG